MAFNFRGNYRPVGGYWELYLGYGALSGLPWEQGADANALKLFFKIAFKKKKSCEKQQEWLFSSHYLTPAADLGSGKIIILDFEVGRFFAPKANVYRFILFGKIKRLRAKPSSL